MVPTVQGPERAAKWLGGMLRFVVVCGVAALSAVGAAQAVVSLDNQRDKAPMAAVATTSARHDAPVASAAGQAAQVAKGKDGHYWADAAVNGTHVRFLVDTG